MKEGIVLLLIAMSVGVIILTVDMPDREVFEPKCKTQCATHCGAKM